MPRFVRKSSIIDAVLFDGSMKSAMECATLIGKAVKISIDGDLVKLSIGRRNINPQGGVWIVKTKDKPWIMGAEAFAERFEPLSGTEQAGMRSEFFAGFAATPQTIAAGIPVAAPGDIEDGDFIIDTGSEERDLELEVMEFDRENHVYVCDSVWGEKRVPAFRAVLLRKGMA